MSLTTNLNISFNGILSNAVGSYQPALSIIAQLASGTSSNQADVVYAAVRTITNSGTPDTIDLRGGTILQPDQSSASFVKIVFGFILCQSATPILTIGGGSNAWGTWLTGTTPKFVCDQNGPWIVYAPTNGYAVTAGTGDILQVATDSGTNVTYAIILVGRSA